MKSQISKSGLNITLAFAFGVFAASAGSQAWANATVTKNTASSAQAINTHSSLIQLEGMTCAACVKSVTTALKKIPQVDQVTVDLRKNQAKVTMKDGAPIDESALRAAIDQAGYTIKTITSN
jgi:copper chaperone